MGFNSAFKGLKQKVQAPFLNPKLGIITPDITKQETNDDIHDFFLQNSKF
jgi:hypothetical protein